MKKLLLVSLCFLFFSSQIFAQNRTITGTVIAKEDGGPIPGVSIKIKGTNIGTVTGADGKYSISAPESSTLIFGFIGYESQERVVGSQSVINVTLTIGTRQLGEVTVVGALGITRTRNQQSYAAQEIVGDEVSKQRSSNFIDGLSGKVSGLEIRQNNTLGGSVNVVIRGNKSLLGDNQALFVIDGVPVNNSNPSASSTAGGGGGYDYGSPASDINPDDIESVTVLKGAGATALYGSRGSNGVIVITTKKAKKGLGILVNTSLSLSAVDKKTLPTYQTQYGAGYGQYFNTANIFGQTNANVAPTADDASWGNKFDPNLLVFQWDAFDPTSPNYGKATPWVAAAHNPTTFFKKPLSTNQSIFITNGSDNGSFKIGYTKTLDNGVLPNSKLDKNVFDLGATYNVSPKLTVGGNVNFYNVNGTGRGGTGYDGTNSDNRNVLTNFRQWWETNVDIQELQDAFDRTNKNTTWNMASPENGQTQAAYWNNPYWVTNHNYETDTRNRFFSNVNANYKIKPYLSVTGRISLDTYSQFNEERYDVGSIGVPYYSRYNSNYSETNYDLLVNFDKDLNKDFNLKALLGTNIRKDNFNSIYASTNAGLVIPGLYALSNTLSAPTSPTESQQKQEVNGIFAGATLTWKKLLTADGTIRRDESSTLPLANNKYYYPSVSGGFIFSELLKQYTWLSYGKLRASYAQVGKDAPIYDVLDTYSIGTPINGNAQAILSSQKNNPNLKPEQTKSKELGLELSFLQNRISFNGSYYHTNTFNEILPVTISGATGYTTAVVNVGNVRNDGVELTLALTPVKTKDFSWTSTFNWTRNRNNVEALYTDASGNPAKNLQLGSFQNGETLNAPLNEPMGIIRGTDFVYYPGTNKKEVKANGQYIITATSNNDIGNTNPNWIGGVNNLFTYKNFSFSFLIDVRNGGDVFSGDLAYGLDDGIYPETTFINDKGNPVRNTLANGGGFIRDAVYANGQPNTTRVDASVYGQFADGLGRVPLKAFVYDASYVKLREAKLSYTLPASLISKVAPFKEVTFDLVGRNLWIIHKNLPYADPEDGLSSGNLQGIQEGSYPSVRTFLFNIKLRF